MIMDYTIISSFFSKIDTKCTIQCNPMPQSEVAQLSNIVRNLDVMQVKWSRSTHSPIGRCYHNQSWYKQAKKSKGNHGRRWTVPVSEGSVVTSWRMVAVSEGMALQHGRSGIDTNWPCHPNSDYLRAQDGKCHRQSLNPQNRNAFGWRNITIKLIFCLFHILLICDDGRSTTAKEMVITCFGDPIYLSAQNRRNKKTIVFTVWTTWM